MSSTADARPQVTAHIDAETRKWLDRYARSLKLKPSELVRLLIRREQNVRSVEAWINCGDDELLKLSRVARRRSASKRL